VRVYSLQVGPPAQAKSAAPAEPAAPEKPSQRRALPDKPSIAILPFANMSGDIEQDYFADGISEDIITALSKLSARPNARSPSIRTLPKGITPTA
jgi:adenylate cyclase